MIRSITRRSFLRAVGGATMALPWLQRRAEADRAMPPTRMAFFYLPNGLVRESFFPKTDSVNFLETPTLEPLVANRDKVSLITGLRRELQIGADVHAQCGSCFLSSAAPYELIKKSAYPLDRTLDHVLADQVGDSTPFRTLELSCNSFKNNKESIYFDNISWYGAGHVAPSIKDPLRLYRKLFGMGSANNDREITSLALEDARSFQQELGYEDKQRLDEYFESVRAVEKRIAKVEQKKRLIADVRMEAPSGLPLPRREYIRLMGDLMIVALRTGLTRVATMMSGPERWGTPMIYEGVFDDGFDHHLSSHEQHRPEVRRDLRRVDRFHLELYAEMVAKMDAIEEGDGSLLDHTLFTLGAGLGDGQTHQLNELPIVIAGSGGGQIKTGRWLQCPKGTPLANLWLSYTQLMGANQRRFADSVEPLARLRA